MTVSTIGWNNNKFNPQPYAYIVGFVVIIIFGALGYKTFREWSADFSIKRQWIAWGIILCAVPILSGAMFLLTIKIFGGSHPNAFGVHHSAIFLCSHVVLNIILGAVCPALWPFSLALGVGWEFLECYTFKWSSTPDGPFHVGCNGSVDLLANMAGLLIGIMIYSYMSSHRRRKKISGKY